MKTFVGRIVTVPDGAGRSVPVSNWGVAQSSRHLLVHGSPIGNAETLGDDADADVGLLDCNSDTSAHEAPPIPRHAASAGDLYQLATAHSAMETDPPRDGPSLQRNNSGIDTLTTDAVHFQCRSARESSHRDHLISVAIRNVGEKS